MNFSKAGRSAFLPLCLGLGLLSMVGCSDEASMKSHSGGMAKGQGVELINASARATTPGMTSSAAYMTIRNTGEELLELTGVESPFAKKSELHTTLMQDGVMKMEHVEVFQLQPGEEASFEPGGYHVMLMGLNQGIKAGDKVPVSLTFNGQKTVTVEAMAMEAIKGQEMAH